MGRLVTTVSKDKAISLKDCSLEQFTEAMMKSNGFGHDALWIKSHFGTQKYCILEENLEQYMHNICQHSMEKFFTDEVGATKIIETFYDEGSETAVTYENLATDYQTYMKIYKSAFVVYENKNKERICVYINKYTGREITYRVYAPVAQEKLLIEWMEYARKNNFYKNKKIDADCQFLQLETVTWNDIILEKKTIDVIRGHVDELFIYSEFLKANNMPMKRGVILAGPPGTGKTMLAKVLAKEVPATVIYCLPSHMERAADDISRICEMAKDLSPAMLIIEDIDWIAENRDEARNAGAVIQLMNYLDGVQEFNDIVTIATTNNVDKIEDAIKNRPGRFDRVISIPKPNAECRMRMFEVFTKRFILDNVDLSKVVQTSKDYAGAHVKDLCVTAALFAIREGSVNSDKRAIVKQEHFDKAIKEVSNIDYASHQKAQISSRRKMGFSSEFDD